MTSLTKISMALLCSISFIFADDLSPTQEKSSSADILYNTISEKVLDWSSLLDTRLSTWMGFDDNDTLCVSNDITQEDLSRVDTFFQNDRYLNETKDIYVRLRLNTYWYSQESNKINARLSAQLPFNKCKKQWKLFLHDIITKQSEIQRTDGFSGGVGIRYDREEKFGINASYSVGLRNSSPYFGARYTLPLHYGTWKIEPVQTFKYSTKYYFEEETNLYLDNLFNRADLFRIQLHRKSASTTKGTDYGLILQYYKNLGKNAGWELTQSFFGNTHYNHFYENDENYNGINNYVTSVSWRENVWKKWFYYEIRPSVNFHKDHNYRPSYSIHFLVDFYFGKYN